jgi:hypothetical protein
MPFARICITLPRGVLAGADRRARALGRSRPWLIVEAMRAYASEHQPQMRGPGVPPVGVTGRGLGPQRLAQLECDLRLTPEQRIRAAEETARLAKPRGTRARRRWILAFDRYEDYLEWKRTADLVP